MTTNNDSSIHEPYESAIDGITVRSPFPVVVYGSVRGLVAECEYVEHAREELDRDREGCRAQGGYSDARVYEWGEQGDGFAGWVAWREPVEDDD